MESAINQTIPHAPWNKGKLVGQKAPLRLKDIWATNECDASHAVCTQASGFNSICNSE